MKNGHNWCEWTLAVLLLVLLFGTETSAIECYSCQNVADVDACHSAQTCLSNQTCYQQTVGAGSGSVSYNLGCIDIHSCFDANGIHGNPGIIGRSSERRQSETNCKECCSVSYCNDQLCAHKQASSCVDDISVDCAKINSLFNICASNYEHASQVCPRFCGLCDYANGNWAEWTKWSSCDITCGNMTQTRRRTCTNPAPNHYGKNCTGPETDIQTCVLQTCPVHGGWSGWESWSVCSVSCGVGMQHRHRTCSNPAPSLFGDHCFGDSNGYKICIVQQCEDSHWTTWGKWSECHVTCGESVKRRERQCTIASPLAKPCVGQSVEVDICFSGAACGDISVRLVNGSDKYQGRIEISLLGSVWGTVCDDGFSTNSAAVVCFMLGFNRSGATFNSAFPDGVASQPILLDDVICSGLETNILACNHTRVASHNCGHSEDVGVVCRPCE